MTDIALKLATWALKKLGDYASDKIKPPVKEHLGLEADDALLKQIQQELQELQRGQVIVQEKLDTIAAEMKLGFKLTQFTEAEKIIRSRMTSFEMAMKIAMVEQKGKKLGDDARLQPVLAAIAQEDGGIRDQLHFIQDALLSRDNPQKESLVDVVNAYYWNKYGGPHGLSAQGVKYGIPSYVKDLQMYVKSIAQLQLTAIYLISWAVDQKLLRAETERAIEKLKEQLKAISDFVPPPIDITDADGRGDAFFHKVTGRDDCFMIRENFGSKKHLVLRTRTEYAYPPYYFVGFDRWDGPIMCPMDYRWKFEWVDDSEGYKLIGWDINSASHNEPRTVQWENNASDRFAGTKNRYTTRNRGTDVVFKIVVMRPSKDSSYTTIRLVDQELWHGTDPNTPKWWFDGRVHDPYTFEVVYQNGQRYNTSFRDSTSGFE